MVTGDHHSVAEIVGAAIGLDGVLADRAPAAVDLTTVATNIVVLDTGSRPAGPRRRYRQPRPSCTRPGGP